MLEKRYAKDALAPAFPVSELQEAVFEHIARLLREDRKDDITFSYLAKHCYCQTSSIAYYFENKTDMLLQFTKYHLHKFYSKSTEYTYTPPEGLSDEEAFDKFILDVVEGSYKRSKVVYWINYLVICNAPANQEFYHYLKLSLLRKLHRYQTIVHYYTQKGILKEEKLYQLFHELCFLGDSIALTNIFQIPITDKSYFETFTHGRLLSAFLKPEYYQKLKEEATD